MLTGGACAATIRVLSSADLKPLLTFAQIIDQAERAYAWKSEGLTSTFPLVFHEFAPGTADMDIKSGLVLRTKHPKRNSPAQRLDHALR